MGQATCRLPVALDEVLDDAVEEVGVFRSDLVRRALVLYMTANPDEIAAFEQQDLPARFVGGGKRTEGQAASSEASSTYDPLEGF